MSAANDQEVPATDAEEEGCKLDDEVAGIHEHRTPLVRPYKQPRLMGPVATVIRTTVACSQFLRSKGLTAELQPDS